ncbi:hypothetical protein BDN70DRAFT_507957 [Pholiota conissans]|uniref:Uncharacterized protein n=1 Tax=Pholiota conissans TaxID=109636 RepID=A0A9P6D363_9AGAR|nr:hypothetical protein BDN70DRAFT_507957 [Pholiota conissans]
MPSRTAILIFSYVLLMFQNCLYLFFIRALCMRVQLLIVFSDTIGFKPKFIRSIDSPQRTRALPIHQISLSRFLHATSIAYREPNKTLLKPFPPWFKSSIPQRVRPPSAPRINTRPSASRSSARDVLCSFNKLPYASRSNDPECALHITILMTLFKSF